MMYKLKGWMDKVGHYDEEIKRVDAKRWDVQIKREKEHYDVEMTGWMKRVAL